LVGIFFFSNLGVRLWLKTEGAEQGEIEEVLTVGRDEEEQSDSAANGDGSLQLGSGHDSALVAI
jgi:hypothetical protein